MAQDNPYEMVLVESFIPDMASGKQGKVRVRPVAGHKYSSSLYVECAKKLREDYPVGTQFILRAKLTDRKGEGEFLYSNPRDEPKIAS